MTDNLPKSKLTKHQTITKSVIVKGGGKLVVKIRFDDECGNGHNTFAVTGNLFDHLGQWEAGGCMHEEIAEYFPELAPYLKWHLVSTDGPMYYIANTIYREGKERDLDAARSCAVWPELTNDQLLLWPEETLKAELLARLPGLMEAFKTDMEALGFIY